MDKSILSCVAQRLLIKLVLNGNHNFFFQICSSSCLFHFSKWHCHLYSPENWTFSLALSPQAPSPKPKEARGLVKPASHTIANEQTFMTKERGNLKWFNQYLVFPFLSVTAYWSECWFFSGSNTFLTVLSVSAHMPSFLWFTHCLQSVFWKKKKKKSRPNYIIPSLVVLSKLLVHFE